MTAWERLFVDVNLATMQPRAQRPYGAVVDGALAIAGGRIAWFGPRTELAGMPEAEAVSAESAPGPWLTPGLIDCHTHLVYAGNRAREFEMRLEGASYEAIARAGGGIVSTVAATREASEEALTTITLGRAKELAREGVTTIEIKSGYGLDTETESKMLRVAGALAESLPMDVERTFLGAHTVPEEFAKRRTGYLDLVCEEMLPAVAAAGLATAVDAYCEQIAFTIEETARVFERAGELGLAIKLHADQLSDSGGAALAARYGALSADHLEYASETGIEAMVQAGTVAVLLPGAYYTLGQTQPPPVAKLRECGVAMAVATDSNPGTSPVLSLLLMLNMACRQFALTPEEAFAGVTRVAAAALGLDDRGTLEVGKRADLAFWDITEPAELAYGLGHNPCAGVVKDGVDVMLGR